MHGDILDQDQLSVVLSWTGDLGHRVETDPRYPRPKASGEFADVWQGLLNPGEGSGKAAREAVALKIMRLKVPFDKEFLKRLERHIRMWAHIEHPNVLPFLGWTTKYGDQCICLASPWQHNGDAMEYLRVHYTDTEDGHVIVSKLVAGTARGLAYLHSQSIVHGNLKGSSILVDSTGAAVLTDFGLSSLANETSSAGRSYGLVGAWAISWMAPELVGPTAFGYLLPTTIDSDNFALGMTIYELLSGRMPFVGLDAEQIVSAVLHGRRPHAVPWRGDPHAVKIFLHCMEKCYAQDPEERFSAADVVQVLYDDPGDLPRHPNQLESRVSEPNRQPLFHRVKNLFGHKKEVSHLAWSHDGKKLASGDQDMCVILWQIEESWYHCKLERRLEGHVDGISLVSWSPDDTILLSAAGSAVKLWDTKSGSCIKTLDHQDYVTGLAWRRDGSAFVSAGMDQMINIWDAAGSKVQTKRLPFRASSMTASSDDRWLIVCGSLPSSGAPSGSSSTTGSHTVESLSNLSGSTVREPGHRTERFIIIDLQTMELYADMPMAPEISSIVLSADSKYVLINLSASEHPELQIWSLAEPRLIRRFALPSDLRYARHPCFGKLGEQSVLSGSEDGQVYLWGEEYGNPMVLHEHKAAVNAVAWNHSHEAMFASCSDDHTVRIWGKNPMHPGRAKLWSLDTDLIAVPAVDD